VDIAAATAAWQRMTVATLTSNRGIPTFSRITIIAVVMLLRITVNGVYVRGDLCRRRNEQRIQQTSYSSNYPSPIGYRARCMQWRCQHFHWKSTPHAKRLHDRNVINQPKMLLKIARTGLRSAESMTVAVLRTLSSLGDRSFAIAGALAWNKLPSHLRLMQSADTFRRYLKTFLFHQAFLS